eukprot:353633-Chlamydomonas_euryale.AAC.6
MPARMLPWAQRACVGFGTLPASSPHFVVAHPSSQVPAGELFAERARPRRCRCRRACIALACEPWSRHAPDPFGSCTRPDSARQYNIFATFLEQRARQLGR